MKNKFIELTEIGKSHLADEDVNVEDLKENEAIIQADYSMISAGTELSRAFALKKGFKYPVRPGYCMVGTILDKGSSLDVEIGDKVFAGCPHGLINRWSVNNKTQGNLMFKLPKGIDLKSATIINLGLVALQGVNLTNVKVGDKVAIFGLGNIGIIAALIFQKMGCEVIGLDPMEYRCNLAIEMGLKHVSFNTDQLKVINDFTNGEGCDIVVDVTGVASAIVNQINAVRRYGQFVLLGSPRQSFECDITPFLNRIHMYNIKVLGAFNQTSPALPVEGSNNSVKQNFDRICSLIMDSTIDVNKLITRVIDPKECEKAYYDLMYNKNEVNCIVYDWTKYHK